MVVHNNLWLLLYRGHVLHYKWNNILLFVYGNYAAGEKGAKSLTEDLASGRPVGRAARHPDRKTARHLLSVYCDYAAGRKE